MPYQREQCSTLRKAEQAFLDVLQADGYNDISIRNLCERVLEPYQIRISGICVRQPRSIPEDAEGEGEFTEYDMCSLPSVAPDCKYFGSMQGFLVYMDRAMYDSHCEEQLIIAVMFLLIGKLDKELLRKMTALSSANELYKAYPVFYRAVVTIGQVLKKGSAL